MKAPDPAVPGRLSPLPGMNEGGEPVFDEPWQARAFALAVELNRTGHLDWPDWAERFSRRIAEFEQTGSIDDNGQYYRLWLDTLEAFAGEWETGANSDG